MNTFRVSETPQEPIVTPQESPVTPPRKSGKVARSVRTVLSGEFLTREGLINHLPFIGFLTVLFVLHIALMYYFDNTHRQIGKEQARLKELQSEYNTTLSTLEMKKQQSHVAKDIESLGLKELHTPPQFIDVEPGFFEEEK
ncbi:MAG: FtsL-like putative cell division protein [Flavobacteriales bacterium]|jgi:hypothetical protein